MFPDFFDRAMQETTAASSSASSNQANRNELFVVSVGGSLLFSDTGFSPENAQRIASSINTLVNEGYKLVLVVGGGKRAREVIESAKQLGASQFELDELGILATRINARLFLQCIPKAFAQVLTEINQAVAVLDQGKIPVFGGLHPGFTTDAVAALLAEKLNATFVNLSNVDGVYSSDPAENKKAKLYRELSFERLFEIVATMEVEAGQHGVLDVPAATVLKRSRIPAIFVNGNNLENFESAVRGKPFNGTLVQHSELETSQAESRETE